MNKHKLKEWILKNCERDDKDRFIGSNKYIKTFYLYGREVLLDGNIKSLTERLREIMDISREEAIKLGKKITSGKVFGSPSEDYLETEGYIGYLIKDKYLMENE